jgi:hypothetical protein
LSLGLRLREVFSAPGTFQTNMRTNPQPRQQTWGSGASQIPLQRRDHNRQTVQMRR